MVKQDKANLRKIEKSLSILANEIRLKILSLLVEQGKKINFNEITDTLNIKRNSLSYPIGPLKNNGFISNELRKDKNDATFS